MKKYKSVAEVFINLLRDYEDDERELISEFCIKNKDKAHQDLEKERDYLEAEWNRLIVEHNKKIKAEIIDELYNKIDEGVCDICEHKDFEADCFKSCNFEVENAKKWLLGLKEQKNGRNNKFMGLQ